MTELDGEVLFRQSTPDAADKAVCGAHGILLFMLDVQFDHFPELAPSRELFQAQVDAYGLAWNHLT